MAEKLNENSIEANGKKKFRAVYLFLALIPFAIMMVVQTVVVLPGLILSINEMANSNLPYDLSTLIEIFNAKYGLVSYTAYGLILIAIFLPWYFKGFYKKEPKVEYKKALGLKPVALCAVVMVCMYFVVTASLTKAHNLFPQLMETYEQLIENSSLGIDLPVTIVYVIIMAPIAEELCYRGITLNYLEKSNMHYLLAVLIQGALFGIMHMNIVQGSYAMILGVMLGYMRYKYKTVILTTAVHIFFNIFGTLIGNWLENEGMTDNMQMWAGIAGALVAAFLLILIVKDKNTYIAEREEQAVTS